MDAALNYTVLAGVFVCSFAISFGLSMFGFIVYYFMKIKENNAQVTHFQDQTYVKLDQLRYSNVLNVEDDASSRHVIRNDIFRPIVKKVT